MSRIGSEILHHRKMPVILSAWHTNLHHPVSTEGISQETLVRRELMTSHYCKVHLNLSIGVGCYFNYREENWTSQVLTPLYAVMKYSKASWEVSNHFERVGSGAFLRLKTHPLKSVSDCGSCGLPKSLHVAWESMGGYFPKAGPEIAGLPPLLRRAFSFLIVLFPPGLTRSVAQTYHFPWIRSSALFLVCQSDCIVFLLLHQLKLLDTLRLFSLTLQSPWPSFSYWWCVESHRKNEWHEY